MLENTSNLPIEPHQQLTADEFLTGGT